MVLLVHKKHEQNKRLGVESETDYTIILFMAYRVTKDL